MSGKLSRRDFLKRLAASIGAVALGGFGTALGLAKGQARGTVWQIDPNLCVQCGRCETNCVLRPSAVKSVHAYALCGYCDLCSGYLRSGHHARTTAAENVLCPTAALRRRFVEDPYYEYVIDEALCVACGRCVKACTAFGNGSLFLQIKHDRCINCTRCRIEADCPSRAIRRVPEATPYTLKTRGEAP